MNASRTARGCLLFVAALSSAAAIATESTGARTVSPAAAVAAGKASAQSTDRARPPVIVDETAETATAKRAARPKIVGGDRRHTSRRVTPRDEYGVVLEDGSYSLFYSY
jgi:hypothetical protein